MGRQEKLPPTNITLSGPWTTACQPTSGPLAIHSLTERLPHVTSLKHKELDKSRQHILHWPHSRMFHCLHNQPRTLWAYYQSCANPINCGTLHTRNGHHSLTQLQRTQLEKFQWGPFPPPPSPCQQHWHCLHPRIPSIHWPCHERTTRYYMLQ